MLRSAAAVLMAASVLAGCGASDDSSALSDGDTRPLRTLVVLSGGNTSCVNGAGGVPSPAGMGLLSQFNSRVLGAPLHDDREIHWVASCYTSDAVVRFVTSDAPATVGATDVAGFAAKVDGFRDSLGAQRLFVLGHSYGGWLAMKVGIALRTSMTELSTIDPISRANCSFVSPGGCTSAPRDFSAADRARLAERSDYWLNVFQRRTWYLHSSAIAEADDNQELDYEHTEIETSEELWEGLQERILQDAKAS